MKPIQILLICFIALIIGCAPRITQEPTTVPHFHIDYDKNKKQIFIKNNGQEDVIYSNYTEEELESITTGTPIVKEKLAVRLQEFLPLEETQHTLEDPSTFILLHDDNVQEEVAE